MTCNDNNDHNTTTSFYYFLYRSSRSVHALSSQTIKRYFLHPYNHFETP